MEPIRLRATADGEDKRLSSRAFSCSGEVVNGRLCGGKPVLGLTDQT